MYSICTAKVTSIVTCDLVLFWFTRLTHQDHPTLGSECWVKEKKKETI